MVLLVFLFTFSLCGSHHHHNRRPTPISVDSLNITIYENAPQQPVPHTPILQEIIPHRPEVIDSLHQSVAPVVPMQDNTRVKLALIGLASSAISSGLTAIIMWQGSSCK